MIIITFIFELLGLIIKTGLFILINPLFWLVLILIYQQFKKIVKKEEIVYGIKETRGSIIKRLLFAFGYGLLGGLLGSFIFVILGVTLSDIGIGFLWLVAILLLLFDIRFICFAYAGSIVSLSSLLLGWPRVNVPAILILVAVMHLVESILIYTNGADRPLPMTLVHKKYGTAGCYLLQKLWPIPFVAMVALSVAESEITAGVIDMPAWWPLIETLVEAGPRETLLYILLPVVAGLGYGDLAVANRPQVRARLTARNLFVYSGLLLILVIISLYYPLILPLAALFSSLGHELVIKKALHCEQSKPPRYLPPEKGLLVMEVYPEYPAAKAGLTRGDIVHFVDGIMIGSVAEFNSLVSQKNRVELILETGEKKILENDEIVPGIAFLKKEANQDLSLVKHRNGILKKLIKKISNVIKS